MRKAYDNKVDVVKRYNIEVTLYNRKQEERQITFRSLGNTDFGNLDDFSFRAVGGTTKYYCYIDLEVSIPYNIDYNNTKTLYLDLDHKPVTLIQHVPYKNFSRAKSFKHKELIDIKYKNLFGIKYELFGASKDVYNTIEIKVPFKQNFKDGKDYNEIEANTNTQLETLTYNSISRMSQYVNDIEITI